MTRPTDPTPTPLWVFRQPIDREVHRRRMGWDKPTLDALQRETNRLLAAHLIEAQLANRQADLGAALVRQTGLPPGDSSPVDHRNACLALFDRAVLLGDEVAMEWARRRLEADPACAPTNDDPPARFVAMLDRPDRVHPGVVASFRLTWAASPAPEAAMDRAMDRPTPSRQVALYLAAMDHPRGTLDRWVRAAVAAVDDFHDAAVAYLDRTIPPLRAPEGEL